MLPPEAAPSLAVNVRRAPVDENGAINEAIAQLSRGERAGLVVLPSAFTVVNLSRIVEVANHYQVPAVYAFRFFVQAGGLMSYGADQVDLFRRSASYVDRIFNGAKPSDLPVQAPTKYLLSINLKTAKALDLTIPQTLVATADEVIE
jgi:putative tryptophan/tyrosine transport system substrate-binding protein